MFVSNSTIDILYENVILMCVNSFFSHSTPVMLGIYITIFIILANILFICAIYSCIKVASLY